jgi:hypothetical protein
MREDVLDHFYDALRIFDLGLFLALQNFDDGFEHGVSDQKVGGSIVIFAQLQEFFVILL